MSHPVTHNELKEILDERFGAVDKRFDALDKRFDELDQRFVTKDNFDSSMRAIAAQFEELPDRAFMRGLMDEFHAGLRVVDDQYKDLPARVTTLEAAVFTPPRARRRKPS